MDPGEYRDSIDRYERTGVTSTHAGVTETYTKVNTAPIKVKVGSLTPKLEMRYKGRDTDAMFVFLFPRRAEVAMTDILVFGGRQYRPVNAGHSSNSNEPQGTALVVEMLARGREKSLA